MLEFIRFELRYRFRQPAVYAFALMFATMAFATITTDAVVIGGGGGQTAIDSPYVVTQMLALMSALALVLVVGFTAGAVVRDYEMGTYPLFFTRPIRGWDLLLGRFLGGSIASVVAVSGASVGLMVGSLMPWLDPARLVGPRPLVHVHAIAVFVVPNLLVMGALFFTLATLTRRMLYGYVGVVAFYVIYAVAQSLVDNLDNETLAALTDPFGLTALAHVTRYWTPVERNTLLVPLEGELLLNRVVWLSIGAAVGALGILRFRMTAPLERGSRREMPGADDVSAQEAPLPVVAPRTGLGVHVRQLVSQFRVELRGIVRSTAFVVIVLFAAANVVGGAVGIIDSMYGTPVYPVTQLMLTVLEGSLSLFILIVVTFYAGEIVWRDRKAGMADVVDAFPVPTWVPMLAKLGALLGAVAILMLAGTATTVAIQLAKGYTTLEPELYGKGLFGLRLSTWAMICVLAFFFHVIANHKFAGYGLMVGYFVLSAALGPMGFEHRLYRYAGAPEATYSDMNGYGHFVASAFWFRAYWAWAAFLLVLIANLFWVRGTDPRLRLRVQQARKRVTRFNTALLAVGTLAFFGTGGFIFYNTNVLNDYLPSDATEDRQQRYEERYKQYEGLAQPRIVGTEIEADIHPKERRLDIRGRYRLANKTEEPIADLHVRIYPSMQVNALSVTADMLVHDDEELGYRIYRLPQPLEPGAEMDFTFDLTFQEKGFKNSGSNTDIVHNGTFFHNSIYVPHFGYDSDGEISDPNERRKRGLPERPRMADIDDERARTNTYISREADWIDFKATISTSPDQIALAPGYLVSEWEENGRRYFRYEMDAPILNLWAILSARWEVARDTWKGIPIEVYYHAPHHYNVQRMIEAVKRSLDYFTVAFSPYQHRQVRIVEFPRYQSYAQSLPNIIPYSESIGFIADLRDEEHIDYVFYVTAHEVAHQWWAHQVIGGNVQGSTLMSETLAQYSALMVMEKEYGRDKMRKFLRHELDRYLEGRGVERHRELPLMLVENQPYIHYNKGSLVMYALREYLGEDVVNGVLAEYIRKVAYQAPPYTTSVELVEMLRAATPEKYAYLIDDLFETITLYDNRAVAAVARSVGEGKWEVDLTISSRKVRADERGMETPVALDDWIPIGVFGEDENGEEVRLYHELHHVQEERLELTIPVSGKPVRAGVDPDILLVDRNPDDNVRRVD